MALPLRWGFPGSWCRCQYNDVAGDRFAEIITLPNRQPVLNQEFHLWLGFYTSAQLQVWDTTQLHNRMHNPGVIRVIHQITDELFCRFSISESEAASRYQGRKTGFKIIYRAGNTNLFSWRSVVTARSRSPEGRFGNPQIQLVTGVDLIVLEEWLECAQQNLSDNLSSWNVDGNRQG